uniref:Uncharacterized protein n=1 Tax=Nelumbo nucifera TaxID=4432 RepID=A0A822XXE9_NELNU|nr:TPA_asm: hypothetical protein HUJ06_026156 [Nelumbo nucifera]
MGDSSGGSSLVSELDLALIILEKESERKRENSVAVDLSDGVAYASMASTVESNRAWRGP